ncbi:hypothetical protein [Ferruginibacter profundus]
MANFMALYLQSFAKWGTNTIYSIILALVVIGITLPFTYIGFAIRRAIEFRIKKYQGYAIKKYTIHALVGAVLLAALGTILFLVANTQAFFTISCIVIAMLVLGLFGFKLTFGVEEMIEGWIDDL